jgi:predicted ATPase
VKVPPTLAGILQARLDGLPPEEKAVLQRASVVGRLFWDQLVAELAADGVEPEEVPRLLAAARGHELVFRRGFSRFAGSDEFIFKHAILRDVTYETVLLRLRPRYHGQVAAWLEAHAGERLGEYLRLIAGHYEAAGDWLRAAEYLSRAGEQSLSVSTFRDAREAFENGLPLLQSGTNTLEPIRITLMHERRSRHRRNARKRCSSQASSPSE